MTRQMIKDKIVAVAKGKNIDPFLMLAFAKVESNFDLNAIGDNGASFGLFQIKLNTARDVGSFPKNISDEELIRLLLMVGPATNTAIKYFKYQYNRYNNKLHAVAAYNEGSVFLRPDGRYKNQGYVNKINKAYKKEKGQYLFPPLAGSSDFSINPVFMLGMLSFIVVMGGKKGSK